MIKIDTKKNETFSLGELASNISERVEPQDTDLAIYVGLEHLDPECIHIKRRGVPADVKGVKLRVYPGDIIFGKRRAYQRKAGLVDFDGICSAHAMVVRANPEVILPELFPFFMHSDVFMHRAVDISEGSLSPTIKWKILAEEKFRLPSLAEQKRLADLLWSVYDVSEKYVDMVRDINKLKDGILRSFYENQSKTKQKRLRDLTSLITKGTTPTTVGFKFLDKGINFIKAESISEDNGFLPDKFGFISNKCHESFKRSQLFQEDILFSIAGVIGRCAMISEDYVPANINQALALIRLEDPLLDKEYLMLFLTSNYVLQHFNRISVKTAQVNVSLKQIRDLAIPIPEIKSQKNLVIEVKKIQNLYKDCLLHIRNTREIKMQLINQIFR